MTTADSCVVYSSHFYQTEMHEEKKNVVRQTKMFVVVSDSAHHGIREINELIRCFMHAAHRK